MNGHFFAYHGETPTTLAWGQFLQGETLGTLGWRDSCSIEITVCSRSAVLDRECAKLFEASYRITLDLAGVPSADGVGLKLLIALWEFGTTLTNVPTDIAQRIESKHKKASSP